MSMHPTYMWMYLWEREKTLKKGWCRHELESFRPRRLCTWLLLIDSDWVKMTLKQQQNAVHDPHNEMRRLRQLTNCSVHTTAQIYTTHITEPWNVTKVYVKAVEKTRGVFEATFEIESSIRRIWCHKYYGDRRRCMARMVDTICGYPLQQNDSKVNTASKEQYLAVCQLSSKSS